MKESVNWTGIKQQSSNHNKYNHELYQKMNRETVSMLVIGYSTAVELEEAINALQLSGVVKEWKMTKGTEGSKDPR